MKRTGPLGLGAALALAAVAAAVTARPPGPETWKTKPIESFLTTGVPVVFHQDKISAMTVVGLFVPGGRAAVPEGLDGLAYLATRLTLEIPDEDKARDLMAQATRMSFVCEEDFSAVFIECLSENLEPALRVAGKIIQDPLMSGLRIGRGKELMELYAQAEEDDAVLVGGRAALAAFFQGRGYGSASYGTEKSRRSIERKDVLEFYRRHFTSQSVFFAVVSDLDPASVRALLDRHFSRFPQGERPAVPAAQPVAPAAEGVRLAKETKQTYIGRAFALPAPIADDHAMGCLLEVLIGKGPGSRLWDLRAVERLAYNVDARLTWTRGGGVLEAFLETENAKAERAEEALAASLRALRERGVTADELEATKTMAKADFLRSAETKTARVRFFGLFEVLGLGFELVSGFDAAIDGLTLDAFNAYIRTVLAPDRALRVTVGPGTAAKAPGG